MPVSCSDSSHRPAAFVASRASGLRIGVGPVGPRMANRGPMKRVARQVLRHGVEGLAGAEVGVGGELVAERHQGVAHLAATVALQVGRASTRGAPRAPSPRDPAASSRRCNSLVNSRLASLDWP